MTTATSEILSETEPELDRHHELVSSTRIEGTPVVNARGEKLGSVHPVIWRIPRHRLSRPSHPVGEARI